MKKIPVLSLLILFVSIVPIARSETFDWPQFRGPNRDGISVESGWLTEWPKSGLKVQWKTNVGLGFSAVSVAGDRAFTMGYRGKEDVVYCLAAETGDVIWEYAYACERHKLEHEGGPASTPATDGERVYTLSRDGHLFCFEAATGEVIWSAEVPPLMSIHGHTFGYVASILLDGDRILVDMGLVLAVDKRTGNLLWTSQPYVPSYGSPVLFESFGTRLLACFNEYGPVIMSASDGREVCRYRWKTWTGINAVTPVVSGNRFFISSGYKTGGAVFEITEKMIEETFAGIESNPGSFREPNIVWKSEVMCNHYTTCVLVDGYLYGMDEATLKCVEFDTGKEMWAQEGLAKGSSLIVADGKLLILSERGELIIADPTPEGIDATSRSQVMGGHTWTAPTLAHGGLYCRNIDGDVVRVDLRKESY